jgi:hypothetical protein
MQLEVWLGDEELQVLERGTHRGGGECGQQQKTRERNLVRAP